jgi:heptosyltransferase-2
VEVLLVRAGALGDLLLLRRTIFALRAAGHLVRLLAPSGPGAALLGTGQAGVEEVLAWEGPDTAALLAGEPPPGRLVTVLDAVGAVVAFTRSEPLVAALRAHAAHVLPHDPAPPHAGPHASTWLARAIEPLALAAVAEPPTLAWSEADHEDARGRTGGLPPGFLALHPGSGSPAKSWPRERFAALARSLCPGAPWLLVLGPAEGGAPPLEGAIVAREWPVRTLGAALSRAGVFVGNDSGVSHLAAACGAPTLALFGPTDPALWAPVGPRVAVQRAPGGALARLVVEEVADAARRLLATSGASGPPSG